MGKVIKVSGPLVIANGLAEANMADVVRVGPQRLIGEMDALLQLASASGSERKAACVEITALCVAVGGPGVVHAVPGVPQIAAVEEARVHGHVRAALIAERAGILSHPATILYQIIAFH